MPPRIPEIRNYADVLRTILKRLTRIDQAIRTGALPKGYQFSTDGSGNIVITRTSDGATGTVVLS
jgi:hypothetical protein